MASSGGRERSNTMETKDRIRRTLVEPVTFADIEAANADYVESDNGVVSRSNTTQATPSGRTRQAGASASGVGAGDGQRSSTYSGGAAPPKPKRSGRSTVVIGKRSGAKIVIKKWGSGGSKKDLFGSAALAGASSADDAATTATAVTATASTASGGRPARPLPSTSTEASPEDASPLSNSPSMEDLPVKDRTSSGSGTGGRPAARRTTEDEDNSEDDDGRRDTADSDAPPDRKPANRKLQTLKSEKGSKRLSSRLKFWTHKKTAHSEATLSTRARVSARSFSQEEPIGAGRGRVATTSTADGDHDGDDIVIEEADDDTPAHFEEDRDDLVFMPVQPGDRRMRIKGGTMEALVERLTYEKYPDPEFMQDFLLTYRSFTTPTELMQMVFERFNVAPPPGATEDEIDEFVKTKQFPIRFRVCNVLKYWVSEHFRDFQDEPGLVDLLRAFVDETLAEAMPKSANQLSRNLQNMIFGEGSTRKIVTMGNAPKPVVKKAWLGEDVTLANTDIAFMDMDPLEVARQLTIIEYAIYRSIKPMECVNKRWSKSAEEAPHLIAMARRFNSVSNWVASEIISAGANVRARASVLKRFIEIAARCRDLNNFNACMEIIAGVHTASISRLKKTWEALNRSTQSTYQALEELTNQAHNYAVMRATIPDVDPPLIPYVGMFLTDLTFIEDGMKDQVGDLTNFAKLRRISVVIRQIQLYQNTPYNLAAVPVMQEYFENLTALSDDELYARSLEYEPRTPRR